MSPQLRRGLQWGLAVFFTLAGLNHFLNPAFYEALIPPVFTGIAPAAFWNYASGAGEVICGVLLMVPRFTRLAAWGIIAILIAVFPANIYHALEGGLDHPDLPDTFKNGALAVARLPFQLLFGLWAWPFTRPPPKPASR